jgi:hypothetical protein
MRLNIKTKPAVLFLVCILTLIFCFSAFVFQSKNLRATADNSFDGTGNIRLASEEQGERPAPQAVVTDLEEGMRSFLGANRIDRTAFSVEEKAAAQYIREQLLEIGFDGGDETLETDVRFQEVSPANRNSTSQNVLARLRSGVQTFERQRVIIGANYDNNYSETESHGAFSNATGVVAALHLARILFEGRDDVYLLPFDVEFVFFGANTAGLTGAVHYVDEFTDDPANILLVINFDSIGGGDNIYLYTDEVSRIHDGFLRERFVESSDIPLLVPPRNRGVSLRPTLVSSYSHVGLWGAHNPFMARGLNVASFRTFNWERSGIFGIFESNGVSVSGTVNDTLAELERLFPRYAENMEACINAVLHTLNHADFTETMVSSFENRPNYRFWASPFYSYLVLLAVLVILAAGMYFYSKHLTKKHPRPLIIKLTPEMLTQKQEGVFGSQYENPNPLDALFKDMQDQIDKQKDENNPFDGY